MPSAPDPAETIHRRLPKGQKDTKAECGRIGSCSPIAPARVVAITARGSAQGTNTTHTPVAAADEDSLLTAPPSDRRPAPAEIAHGDADTAAHRPGQPRVAP